MAAARDPEDVPAADLGTAVAPADRELAEGRENVQAGDGGGDALEPRRLAGHGLPGLLKDPIFDLGHPLLGVEDLFLVGLELGSEEALRADEGLLADVVRRDLGEIGLRDVDVIAEDLVVPDLEGRDARPLPLGLLQPGDEGLPRPRDLPQLVELGIEPRLDDPAFREPERRLVEDRLVDEPDDVPGVVPSLPDLQERACLEGLKDLPDLRQGLERPLESDQVPGVGGGQGYLSREPFQVVDAFEDIADLAPLDGQADRFGHGVQTGVDESDVGQGLQEPISERPRPHRGHREVHDLEQGVGRPSVAEVPDELEVPDRRRVQDEPVAGGHEDDPVDQGDGILPDLLDVVEERAGGRDGQELAVQAESRQGLDPEVFLEEPGGLGRVEGPGFDRAQRDRRGFPGREDAGEDIFGALRIEDLPGRRLEQLVGGRSGVVGPSLERPDLAGDEVEPGQPPPFPGQEDGRDIGVLPGLAVLHLDRGSGGQDLDDLALDHALRRPRVLHLLADGDLESAAQELRQVRVDGVVGDAAHRDFLARGQGDLEHGGGRLGVLVEHLVEVAQPEEQQRSGVLLLDAEILLHHRGQGAFFGHGNVQIYSQAGGFARSGPPGAPPAGPESVPGAD